MEGTETKKKKKLELKRKAVYNINLKKKKKISKIFLNTKENKLLENTWQICKKSFLQSDKWKAFLFFCIQNESQKQKIHIKISKLKANLRIKRWWLKQK